MTTYAVVPIGLALSLAAVALDQKPNFTRLWKHGDNGSTVLYEIEHREPNLKIAFRADFSAGSLGGTIGDVQTYTTDGVERATQTSSGRNCWTTVTWQGSSLVILRVMKDGYRVTVTRDAWTLSEDGGTLTKARRTIKMEGVTEDTEVYHRQ